MGDEMKQMQAWLMKSRDEAVEAAYVHADGGTAVDCAYENGRISAYQDAIDWLFRASIEKVEKVNQ